MTEREPDTQSPQVIEAYRLVKTYEDRQRGVDGLDLGVSAGEVYGLAGRNGAGKSTVIGCLLGLLRPTTGTALVLGQDLRFAPPDVRASVSAVLQEPRLPDAWTARDLMDERSWQYPGWDVKLADRLAKRFELARDLQRPTGTLSGGQRRALSMLLALATRPEVLVLDEPAANLDPIARRALLDALVESLAEDRPPTVLISTHILADLERLADRVGIMDHGQMMIESSVDELRSRFWRAQWVFDVSAPQGARIPVPAFDLRREGRVMSAVVDAASLADPAVGLALPGARLDLFPLSLEDVFVAVMRVEGRLQVDTQQGRS